MTIHTPENVEEQFTALRKNYYMFDWRREGHFALVAIHNVPMVGYVKFRVTPPTGAGFRARMTHLCVVDSGIKPSACEAFSDLLQRLTDLRVSLQSVASLVHSEEGSLREQS